MNEKIKHTVIVGKKKSDPATIETRRRHQIDEFSVKTWPEVLERFARYVEPPNMYGEVVKIDLDIENEQEPYYDSTHAAVYVTITYQRLENHKETAVRLERSANASLVAKNAKRHASERLEREERKQLAELLKKYGPFQS